MTARRSRQDGLARRASASWCPALAGSERLPDGADLVAGGDHGDPGARRTSELGAPAAAAAARSTGAAGDPRAAAARWRHVLADRAHVLVQGATAARSSAPAAGVVHVLAHDHRVAPVGSGSPVSTTSNARPPAAAAAVSLAPGGVRGAHRDAVHRRRRRTRGEDAKRPDRLGGDPARAPRSARTVTQSTCLRAGGCAAARAQVAVASAAGMSARNGARGAVRRAAVAHR